MAFYTYILQSKCTGSLYIGQTNNVEDRLKRHNNNESKATKRKGPWELLYYKEFETRAEAVQLERMLKNWKKPSKVLFWIKRQSG